MKVRKRTYPSGKEAWEFWVTKKETGVDFIRKGGYPTKKAATNAAVELLNDLKIQTGLIKYDSEKTTFDDLYNIFINQAELSYSEGTVSNYKGLYKNHFKKLHGKTLSELNPYVLDCWKKELIKNCKSVFVVNNCIKLINAIFGYCGNKHLIPKGIYEPLKKLSEPKKERNRISLELLAVVFQICREQLPEFYPILIIAIFTGMRVGEYSYLKVEDIDFENQTIRVNSQFTKRKIKDKLKNTSSVRQPDAPLFVFDIIKKHIEDNNITKGLLFKAIRPNKKTLERNNNKEIPVSYNWIRERFKRLLVLCSYDERYMRVHDMRGEYVDIERTAGMTMEYISRQVGHARKSTTENCYSSIFNSEGKEAKEKIQEKYSDIV